ncbi:MAG: flagellar hook protein FlgE [Candidatus Tectomicrobia bacterium]|uniref:Flagellar hook protein FlgE n=1 Tax=Tectimicrobiota bacterium TaxID=2528274 RepID=A0A932CQT7_UNCTE|nr:flagellar hook protein FlgE [Candidatus Tectomicrobia bacterium]
MSLSSSLFIGISGLSSSGTALSLVSNNIANLNTVGFKGSRATFEEVLASTQLGGGTDIASMAGLFSQGSLENTESPTDLAIDGEGFFIVKDDKSDELFYTRAGQFFMNSSGNLANPDGLVLQGWAMDAEGNRGNIGNITLRGETPILSPPKATEDAKFTLNLDAREEADLDPFTAANAAATSHYSSSMTLYDADGNGHTVTLYFRKSAADAWEVHAVTDGGNVEGGTPGTPQEIPLTTSRVRFDNNGNLIPPEDWTPPEPSYSLTVDFAVNGEADTDEPQTITLDLDNTTQFASTSSVLFQEQDGYALGFLSRFSIDQEGFVQGTFTNGQSRPIYQIALANFSNPQGLDRIGGSLFVPTPRSGDPTPPAGQAGNGNLGRIVSNTLEQSNVDLAGEFVRLITLQRGFQANARTISSTSQLLQELINIVS